MLFHQLMKIADVKINAEAKELGIAVDPCNPALFLGREVCYLIKANLGYVSRTTADRAM